MHLSILDKIEKEINTLNVKQKKVVNEIDRNLLLLASAGTGKTKALALRIANIINMERANPDQILCLTFTNRACKEMKERIISTVGLNGTNVVVRTFHSFCFDIIKAEAKRNTDISTDFIIFDEEDCKELLKEFNPYKLPINALHNFVSYMKEQSLLLDYDNYRALFAYIMDNKYVDVKEICINDDYSKSHATLDFVEKYGDRLVEEYDKALHERHGMDFNDLLIKVHSLFQDKSITDRWNKKFKYIHIDEVQDTSQVEYSIISTLFAQNNVMMCGDYFQTIYEWRGSNPHDIFSMFKQDCSPINIIFNENYRATQNLLEASHGYLENTFKGMLNSMYDSGIKSNSSTIGDKIVLKNAYDIKEEAEWIFKKIIELNLKDISKVAILTRSNNTNVMLSRIFERENSLLGEKDRLKFLLVDDFKFFRRQEIKDIIAFLKFSINKFDNNSLKRIIKRSNIGVGDKSIESIENKGIRKSGVRLSDFVDINTHRFGEPYQLLLNEIENSNVIVFDVESTGVNTTEDEIIQIAGVKINKYGQEIERFERFLKPSKPVGQSGMVHGFSDEILSKCGEDSNVVLKSFLEFIEGSIIVGHNVSYDITILSSQLSRLGLPRPKFLDYYDTLDISRRFYPNLDNHKLEYLSEYFETEIKSDHDAMNDVLSTKDILIKMIDEHIRPSVMNRISIYNDNISKFSELYKKIITLRIKQIELRPYQLIDEIIEKSNLLNVYEDDENKISNMNHFSKLAKDMDDINLSCSDALNELLKITSLSNSEMDIMLNKHPQIPIITIHQAKGSEFDYVFLAGLQEYKFPTYQSIKSGNLSEEQRVFYVAITRAKLKLYLSWAGNERGQQKRRSRFIDAIPDEYIEIDY